MLCHSPPSVEKPQYGRFWPNQPVTAVGTAMIAPQEASFFMIVLSRASCSDRLVSKTEVTMSRSDSDHSAARNTWS